MCLVFGTNDAFEVLFVFIQKKGRNLKKTEKVCCTTPWFDTIPAKESVLESNSGHVSSVNGSERDRCKKMYLCGQLVCFYTSTYFFFLRSPDFKVSAGENLKSRQTQTKTLKNYKKLQKKYYRNPYGTGGYFVFVMFN